MRLSGRLAAVVLAIGTVSVAQAQERGGAERFPERTVRFIVPVTPGALIDSFARILAARLQGLWGQNVVVENRTGSAGVIGVPRRCSRRPTATPSASWASPARSSPAPSAIRRRTIRSRTGTRSRSSASAPSCSWSTTRFR